MWRKTRNTGSDTEADLEITDLTGSAQLDFDWIVQTLTKTLCQYKKCMLYHVCWLLVVAFDINK